MAQRLAAIVLFCAACASRSVTHDALAETVRVAIETLNDPQAPESAKTWARKTLEEVPEKIQAAGEAVKKESERELSLARWVLFAGIIAAVFGIIAFFARR